MRLTNAEQARKSRQARNRHCSGESEWVIVIMHGCSCLIVGGRISLCASSFQGICAGRDVGHHSSGSRVIVITNGGGGFFVGRRVRFWFGRAIDVSFVGRIRRWMGQSEWGSFAARIVIIANDDGCINGEWGFDVFGFLCWFLLESVLFCFFGLVRCALLEPFVLGHLRGFCFSLCV